MLRGEAYFLHTWRGMCNYEQNEEYDEGDKVEKAKAECGGRIKLRRSANVQAELGGARSRAIS